jgi:stress-induced-phosphoprotein 1
MRGKMEIQHQMMAGGQGDQPDQERLQQAMKDPEIQSILRDPQVNLLLERMKTDPKATQDILQKDQKMANAIEKLMLAGIVRMG